MTLHRWLRIFHDLRSFFPIYYIPSNPPLRAIHFTTDAAGVARRDQPFLHDVGVGAIGIRDPDPHFRYVGQALWPRELVRSLVDVNGKEFGQKMTMLEAAGLLLPFCHKHRELAGQYIVFEVDNLSVVWAYSNGRSRTDDYASVLVMAINDLAMRLHAAVYVKYCRRLSTPAAAYADVLTRGDEKGVAALRNMFPVIRGWHPVLSNWLQNPTIDWDFPSRLADAILQD